MMFAPQVFISLTTIPSRVNSILRTCLDDLMLQTYPVTAIILTIPKRNMRGHDVDKTLPAWLLQEPYCDQVTIIRPESDYGPILKYIGGKDCIPDGAWTFVCDDDQKYRHDGIARMVAVLDALSLEKQTMTILNSPWAMESTLRFSMRLISGFAGVLVPKSFIDLVDREFDPELPLHALRIDDDLVSIFARDNGFAVLNCPDIINYKHYFGTSPNDALGKSYDRHQDRHLTHTRMNNLYVDNLVCAVSASTVLLVVFVAGTIVATMWGLNIVGKTTAGGKVMNM